MNGLRPPLIGTLRWKISSACPRPEIAFLQILRAFFMHMGWEIAADLKRRQADCHPIPMAVRL